MSDRRRARWWVVNVLIPTLLLIALVVAVVNRSDDFQSLRDIPITEIVLVGVLALVGFFLNGQEFGLLYRILGAPIGTFENWMLYSAGQLGNYLPGQVGTLYRFRYLKDVYRLGYAHATAAYSINFVITVFATGTIGLIGCVGLLVIEGTWSFLLAAILAGLMGVAIVTAVLPIPGTERTGRIGDAWRRFGQGWSQVRAHRRTALAVLGLEVLRYALLAARLQIAFGWVGSDEPYSFFLVIAPIGALATFVAITPAGLGIREFVIAFATVALGRDFDEGLLGSAAERAIALVVVLATGAPGAVLTLRRLRAVPPREDVVPA